MTTAHPWQLCAFCAFALLTSITSFTLLSPFIDPCDTGHGHKCDAAETVAQNFLAMADLFVAIFFLILTLRNKGDAPKIKRLSFFAIHAVITNLTCVIMFGSDHLGGVLPRGLHITAMAIWLVLLVIMASAVVTDSPISGSIPFKDNLGLNMKGFLSLYSLMVVVWIFLNSDVQKVSDVVIKTETYTDLAKMLWFAWSAEMLVIFLVLMFAVRFGDDRDHQALCVSIILLYAFGMIMMNALKKYETAGILKGTYIQMGTLAALSLLVLIRHRIEKRRGDYQAVPESNVV